MGRKKHVHNRVCYICKNTKTTLNSRGHENWYGKPYGYDKPLCDTCYGRLVEGPRLRASERFKNWNKAYVKKQFRFRDKRIHTNTIQRTGYCSQCPNNTFDGTCKKTDMHHWVYLTCLPWFGIEERCSKCHGRITSAGRKQSYETIQKRVTKLRGKIPWNKGLRYTFNKRH